MVAMTLTLIFSCVFAAQSLLAAPMADTAARERWKKHRAENDVEAGGPDGYLAIQGFQRLAKGESVSLYAPKDHEKAELRKTEPSSKVRVEFDGTQVRLVEGESAPVNLLDQKEKRVSLKNGLVIRSGKPRSDQTVFVYLHNFQRKKYKKFKGHPYFPYSAKGVVAAKFEFQSAERVPFVDSLGLDNEAFKMGVLKFSVAGKPYEFPAYDFGTPAENPESLSLLFTDGTSGISTYGGGRALVFDLPQGKSTTDVQLDFNSAYSFLCAHSPVFRCPIRITKKIEAKMPFGERYTPKNH